MAAGHAAAAESSAPVITEKAGVYMPEGGSRRILGKERDGGGADCRRHPRLRGLRSGRRASSFWTRGVVTVYEVHPVKAESARECRSWVGRS
jgi:hypothetical protein